VILELFSLSPAIPALPIPGENPSTNIVPNIKKQKQKQT
jgi:hypothetical protein